MNFLVIIHILFFFIIGNFQISYTMKIEQTQKIPVKQKVVSGKISITTPEKIKDFAKTITNRLEVLMDIKAQRWKQVDKKQKIEKPFNPNKLTQTEAYLLAKTEKQDITLEALEKAIDQQIKIQKQYFGFPQKPGEVKKMVKKIIKNERKYSDYYVLYHAYRGVYTKEQTVGPGLLFDFYSELYKWVFILPQSNKLLRLFNKGYKKYPNVNTLFERFTWKVDPPPDHVKEFIAHVISANVSLFGNTYTRYQQESTFSFFLISSSWIYVPNIRLRIEKIFDLFNFNKQHIDKLVSIYKSYMQKSGGHLLQIFIAPETVNDVAYLSLQGGFFYDQKITESYDNKKRRHTDISSVLDFYKTNINLIPVYTGRLIRYFPLMKTDKKYPYDFLQARILTVPTVFADTKKVKIIRYFALEQPNEQAYKRDLHNIMKIIMQDWITQKIKNKKLIIHPELIGRITNIDILMSYILEDPSTLSLWHDLVEGKLKTIKNLVDEKKLSLNDSIRGYTPLMIATKYKHEDIVKWILKKAKTIKINIDQTNAIGYSALMYAVEKNDNVICELLLQAGSNANQQFSDGYSLLTKAIKNKNLEIVKLLVKYKAQLNRQDIAYKKTPIMHALESQLVDICKVLLKAGSLPNQKYSKRSNLLTEAIGLKNLEIIKLLVKHKAKIDAFNGTENTPIFQVLIKIMTDNKIKFNIIQALLESPILPDLNSINNGFGGILNQLEWINVDKKTLSKLLELLESKGLKI